MACKFRRLREPRRLTSLRSAPGAGDGPRGGHRCAGLGRTRRFETYVGGVRCDDSRLRAGARDGPPALKSASVIPSATATLSSRTRCGHLCGRARMHRPPPRFGTQVERGRTRSASPALMFIASDGGRVGVITPVQPAASVPGACHRQARLCRSAWRCTDDSRAPPRPPGGDLPTCAITAGRVAGATRRGTTRECNTCTLPGPGAVTN